MVFQQKTLIYQNKLPRGKEIFEQENKTLHKKLTWKNKHTIKFPYSDLLFFGGYWRNPINIYLHQYALLNLCFRQQNKSFLSGFAGSQQKKMIEPQDYSQPCIQVCGGGPSNWEVYQCNYNPSIQWNKGKEGQRGCKTISFGYNSHHNLWEEKLPCKTHFINQWKNISDYICTGELTIITTQFHTFSIRK